VAVDLDQLKPKGLQEQYDDAVKNVDRGSADRLAKQIKQETGSFPRGYAPASPLRRLLGQKPKYENNEEVNNNSINDIPTDDDQPFGQDLDAPDIQGKHQQQTEAINQSQVAPTPAEIAQQQAEQAAQLPQQAASQTPSAAHGIDGVTPPTQSQQQAPTPDNGDNGQKDQTAKVENRETATQPQNTENNQLQNKIGQGKDISKSEADKAAKVWIKNLWMSLFANPIFWWAIAILTIILVIAVAAWFISVSKSGANGETPVQTVNAITDKSALEKLALLSGDKDIQSKLSNEVLTEVQNNLSALLTETTNDSTKTIINNALTATQNCAKTPPDTEACSSLPIKIKAVLVAFAQDISVVPTISGKNHAPIDENKITKNQDNWFEATWAHSYSVSLHGLSQDVAHHSLYLTLKSAWSKRLGLPNVYGEALDLPTSNGATIYAPISGKIAIISNGREPLVIIQSETNPGTVALLANLDSVKSGNVLKVGNTSKKVGDAVTAGDVVGHIIHGHLHFELWVDGKVINAGPKFNKPQIWENMKKALGVS